MKDCKSCLFFKDLKNSYYYCKEDDLEYNIELTEQMAQYCKSYKEVLK